MVQAKVSPKLCFAWGYSALDIKQSVMAPTCAGLGDSQEKPSCESRLAAAGARSGTTYKRYGAWELAGGLLRPVVAGLR